MREGAPPVIERGGLLFYRPEDAIRVIQALEERAIRVYGLDAFRVTPDSVQPFMEHSLNVSDDKDPWSTSTRFLMRYTYSEFVFEVVSD